MFKISKYELQNIEQNCDYINRINLKSKIIDMTIKDNHVSLYINESDDIKDYSAGSLFFRNYIDATLKDTQIYIDKNNDITYIIGHKIFKRKITDEFYLDRIERFENYHIDLGKYINVAARFLESELKIPDLLHHTAINDYRLIQNELEEDIIK